MINTQHKFLEYLKEIETEVKKTSIPTENFNFESLSKEILDTQLVIPIIGAFSAGKSALLNSFLTQQYLAENITPETALATELRYSTKEYIEAVKADGSVTEYRIGDGELIKENASLFKFLRMYINNTSLKNIEPLILVDMPGFESPLDLHNQAIIEYINRGVHFIVLTSVEDGTITRSMVRQLTDIQAFERDFSFFLSKTNLKADNEVSEIQQGVKQQLEKHFNLSKEIITVDNNGGESFQKIIANISPDNLFKNLFIVRLKDNYYSIIEAINTVIETLGKDKTNNEQNICELKQALESQIKKRDDLLAEVKEKYSNQSVNRIVEAVGRELSDNVEDLITAAKGGTDTLSQQINEIVRHSLIRQLKESINEIGEQITDTFSTNLSELDQSMSASAMPDSWLERITDSTKILLNSAQGGLDSLLQKSKEKQGTDPIYKVITTILAITTTVLSPILEVLIVFLPEILAKLFNSEQKQAEKLRTTLLTQVIPDIKREIRSKIPEIFNQQIQQVVKSISDQFETKIQQRQDLITTTQHDIASKIKDIDQIITDYKAIASNISSISNQTLFSEE